MFIFVGRNWKTSIIQKNIIFPDYRAFPDSADRNGHWISVLQVENPKEHLFYPFNSHFHKKTVDNSECHAITATKKSLKTSKRIFFSFWHTQSMPLQIGVIRSTDAGQLGLAVCAL